MNDYKDFKRDTDLAVEKIRTGAMTMAQGAIELGYQLKVARDTGILQDSGYSTMTEFARAEYGIRSDETGRYIKLNDKYSENGYSRRIKDQYTDIGKTILVDMLQLPDLIRDEITQKFTREDVRSLNDELDEEKAITDLEVMMEEKDQVQEELPSILEKTTYQLGKDNPWIYADLFETLYTGDGEIAEILAPDEEKIYSLRIPGTGRILLSLKVSEQEVKIINVRSQEKEMFSWQQLEAAFRRIMDYAGTPEESWEKQYGEEFPKKVKGEPEETKQNKKSPKVQKAKKATKENVEKPVNDGGRSQETALDEKTASVIENSKINPDFPSQDVNPKKKEKSQETAPEEQIPGQDSILNHEEYMPKPVTENPQIAPAQQHEVVDKPIRRKEYLDSLTEYGAADYIARAFKGFGNITFSQLQNTNFWLRWMDTQVDHLGRPWVE